MVSGDLCHIRLNAAAQVLLGPAIVVVGPQGKRINLDGPLGAQELRELTLKVGLVGIPLVTNW